MPKPHPSQPDERVKGQLSDWTVRLALCTIFVLGLVVVLSTGSVRSAQWDMVDQSAIQVRASAE